MTAVMTMTKLIMVISDWNGYWNDDDNDDDD